MHWTWPAFRRIRRPMSPSKRSAISPQPTFHIFSESKMSTVKVNPLAGKPAPASLLTDIPKLMTDYFTLRPDGSVPAQQVSFGTSGHRGTAFDRAFNEW